MARLYGNGRASSGCKNTLSPRPACERPVLLECKGYTREAALRRIMSQTLLYRSRVLTRSAWARDENPADFCRSDVAMAPTHARSGSERESS